MKPRTLLYTWLLHLGETGRSGSRTETLHADPEEAANISLQWVVKVVAAIANGDQGVRLQFVSVRQRHARTNLDFKILLDGNHKVHDQTVGIVPPSMT